ncbi:MAG: EAL domain-containing protein [Eubacteriales bacterium]|nr:EAL domain-containing protein [Eubacteriales bacterium]
MNEKRLNKKLFRSIVICLGIAATILMVWFGVLSMMNDSLNEMMSEQMETEAREYRRRITRQIDKDFQTLHTLSAFFTCEDVTKSDDFDDSLCRANQNNNFIGMAYFGMDGTGTMVQKENGMKTQMDYRELNEMVQGIMEKAYRGEPALSDLFDSTIVSDRIFVYALPVFDEQKNVMGVLSAGNNVETFEEVLASDRVINGTGSVSLVNEEGEVLLSLSENDDPDIVKELFESSLDEEEEQKDAESLLGTVRKEEGIYTHLDCGKREYHVYLTPVKVNGWYVMCINSRGHGNYVANQMVNTLGSVFLMLLVLILSLLICICHMIAKNNKNLTELAYQDALTGADNLLRFQGNLTAVRKMENQFCLVILNVHQFKFVNEIFGVKEANRFLCNIAGGIEEHLGEEEFFCRESGDNFYLYLKEDDERVIRDRIEALMDDICITMVDEKVDYQILLYAGAVLYDERDGVLSNELLITRARFATKYCKMLPGEFLHFYDEEIHKSEEMENYVETHMHQALEREEFQLFLQPKMDLEDGSLGGAEALVRWVPEDRDIIYPGAFIPQFERNGFCVQLDMYMAEMVFKQIRAWMDEGISPIPISVNQSKLMFFDAHYIRFMADLVEKYQVPANLITLEILEGLALEHAKELNRKLERLREMGFRISMDDFGSGYASFNTLANLEIDELKLDRSFLLEMSEEKGGRYARIMGNIINLAKSMGIVTVTEGVERAEDEELIRNLGCDYGQGFLYSKPISAEEFTRRYMR